MRVLREILLGLLVLGWAATTAWAWHRAAPLHPAPAAIAER